MRVSDLTFMSLGKGLSALIPKKQNKLSEFNRRDFASPPSGETLRPVNRIMDRMAEAKDIMGRPGVESVFYVELEKIKSNPHQPRRDFNEDALRDLANSIGKHGVIQPLVVSKIERVTGTGRRVEYQLIAGERRLRAAKIIGISQVPVVIREASEKQKLELALVENIQRTDLNPIEKANAFKKLVDNFNLSHKEVAERIYKSREAVSNILRLLSLPIEIQRGLSEGKISEGHARAILALSNQEKQRALFHEILEKKLTVRQVESIVSSFKAPGVKKAASPIDPETKELESRLQEALGTKVRLHKKGGSGKIVIEFYSPEELEKFLAKMGINSHAN